MVNHNGSLGLLMMLFLCCVTATTTKNNLSAAAGQNTFIRGYSTAMFNSDLRVLSDGTGILFGFDAASTSSTVSTLDLTQGTVIKSMTNQIDGSPMVPQLSGNQTVSRSMSADKQYAALYEDTLNSVTLLGLIGHGLQWVPVASFKTSDVSSSGCNSVEVSGTQLVAFCGSRILAVDLSSKPASVNQYNITLSNDHKLPMVTDVLSIGSNSYQLVGAVYQDSYDNAPIESFVGKLDFPTTGAPSFDSFTSIDSSEAIVNQVDKLGDSIVIAGTLSNGTKGFFGTLDSTKVAGFETESPCRIKANDTALLVLQRNQISQWSSFLGFMWQSEIISNSVFPFVSEQFIVSSGNLPLVWGRIESSVGASSMQMIGLNAKGALQGDSTASADSKMGYEVNSSVVMIAALEQTLSENIGAQIKIKSVATPQPAKEELKAVTGELSSFDNDVSLPVLRSHSLQSEETSDDVVYTLEFDDPANGYLEISVLNPAGFTFSDAAIRGTVESVPSLTKVEVLVKMSGSTVALRQWLGIQTQLPVSSGLWFQTLGADDFVHISIDKNDSVLVKRLEDTEYYSIQVLDQTLQNSFNASLELLPDFINFDGATSVTTVLSDNLFDVLVATDTVTRFTYDYARNEISAQNEYSINCTNVFSAADGSGFYCLQKGILSLVDFGSSNTLVTSVETGIPGDPHMQIDSNGNLILVSVFGLTEVVSFSGDLKHKNFAISLPNLVAASGIEQMKDGNYILFGQSITYATTSQYLIITPDGEVKENILLEAPSNTFIAVEGYSPVCNCLYGSAHAMAMILIPLSSPEKSTVQTYSLLGQSQLEIWDIKPFSSGRFLVQLRDGIVFPAQTQPYFFLVVESNGSLSESSAPVSISSSVISVTLKTLPVPVVQQATTKPVQTGPVHSAPCSNSRYLTASPPANPMNPVPKSSVPSTLSPPVVEITSASEYYLLKASELSLTNFNDCKITTNELPEWILEGMCVDVLECDEWALFFNDVPDEFTKTAPFYFQIDVTCQQYWTAGVRLVFYNGDVEKTGNKPDGAEKERFAGVLLVVSLIFMLLG